ncbi:MAG: arylesterase [Chitinophagales bacterium]
MISNKITFPLLILAFAFLLACNQNNSQKEQNNLPEKEEKKPSKKESAKVILFFGNSLTAGYGVEPEEAYPSIIQDSIDASNYDYKVINAGVSGETTASGNSRIDWVLQQQPVSIFVLELGGNDGLRGIPESETEKNLKSMIDKVREKAPDAKIILTGMMVPPNMGEKYGTAFNAIFPKVAEEKEVLFLPFLLEGVAGESELNLEDGIHPNPEGHKIVAENVWEVLKLHLEKASS